MSQNQMIEEIWRIKDRLAKEAEYDVHQFFENLRRWSAGHPYAGRIAQSGEELRQGKSQELAESRRQNP